MLTRARHLAAVLAFGLTVLSAAPALASDLTSGGTMTIAQVAALAKPSVVGILNTMETTGASHGRAAGTGFVYKPGVIITNAHVVEKAVELKILYADRSVETVTPANIFADEVSDIAVVKVTKAGLVPLSMGDSDKQVVGEPVLAIGNPLGFRLGNSVTSGILSGTGRAIGSGIPFLQMDAAINPGNSGGPLFNLNGEVIGVNSAKMAEIGVEGLSFAIPSNTAKQIAETLLRDGKVERVVLGIDLDEDWQAYFGVPNAEGVSIANVISDGPAGLTALSAGDKLIKLDDTPIYTTDDVNAFLLNKKPGDVVKVTVRRGGQLLAVNITLVSRDSLKQVAEAGRGADARGILIDLTPSQVQDAANFGKNLSRGISRIDRNYAAVSGSDYAVLWTEYLYVARRLASAYEFGLTPSVAFQQAAAQDINKQLEVQMELQGDKDKFLDGATFALDQGSRHRDGILHSAVNYTASTDGKVVIADLAVRFSSVGLSPTDDLTVTVQRADGKTSTFTFTIKDLR